MVCFICSFSKFGRFVLFRAVFARLGLGRVFFYVLFWTVPFRVALFRGRAGGVSVRQDRQSAAAGCCRDILQQARRRRRRQPAAAPGRRAAPLRRRPVRSAAGSLLGDAVAVRLGLSFATEINFGRGRAGYSRPPGGGLLLYVADPSARLRARFSAMPLLFGRGLALRLESTSKRSAGRSLPAAEARSSLPNLLALSRLRPNSNS